MRISSAQDSWKRDEALGRSYACVILHLWQSVEARGRSSCEFSLKGLSQKPIHKAFRLMTFSTIWPRYARKETAMGKGNELSLTNISRGLTSPNNPNREGPHLSVVSAAVFAVPTLAGVCL